MLNLEIVYKSIITTESYIGNKNTKLLRIFYQFTFMNLIII